MCKSIPTVDGAEIQRRLHELAQISVLPDRLWRPSYTPQEGQARRLLTSWFAQAGLSTRLDAAGNLFGRAGGAGQVTLIGSHMDTVKGAGAYSPPSWEPWQRSPWSFTAWGCWGPMWSTSSSPSSGSGKASWGTRAT